MMIGYIKIKGFSTYYINVLFKKKTSKILSYVDKHFLKNFFVCFLLNVQIYIRQAYTMVSEIAVSTIEINNIEWDSFTKYNMYR